jgi:hypothetical protein
MILTTVLRNVKPVAFPIENNEMDSQWRQLMQLGLLYRHEQDLENEILDIFQGQSPEFLIGYISGRDNPEPGYVVKRLKEIHMPANPLYIPMFVYAGKLPKSLNDVNTGSWGPSYFLNPKSVVPDLEIVCRWDIKNATKGRKPADWFTNLRGLSFEEKVAALLEAARITPKYAEARMYRQFCAEDFL